MSSKQYFEIPNHIPRFADRLRLYLSGITGNSFERTPAMKAGGVDEPQEERVRRGVSTKTLLPPKDEFS